MELVEELNEFTEIQRAVMDVKNTMNLYTAEALSWLLEIGRTVEFREGNKVLLGKDDFKVMTFHAEDFKPGGVMVNLLLEKHRELAVPYYNAEMLYRYVDLLVAPDHLKARHEEYVIKLNKAANLLNAD